MSLLLYVGQIPMIEYDMSQFVTFAHIQTYGRLHSSGDPA